MIEIPQKDKDNYDWNAASYYRDANKKCNLKYNESKYNLRVIYEEN